MKRRRETAESTLANEFTDPSDLKIKEDIFVVLEVGSDKKTINNENIRSKVNGSYYKFGFNYNFYKPLEHLL